MYFFLIIELFPLPVRHSLLKYLLWEKYCNCCYFPMTTAQDDRFATSCENIVSRSQILSLPHPPPPSPLVGEFALQHERKFIC